MGGESRMDCDYCGGKMIKLKYLQHNELEAYLWKL